MLLRYNRSMTVSLDSVCELSVTLTFTSFHESHLSSFLYVFHLPLICTLSNMSGVLEPSWEWLWEKSFRQQKWHEQSVGSYQTGTCKISALTWGCDVMKCSKKYLDRFGHREGTVKMSESHCLRCKKNKKINNTFFFFNKSHFSFSFF